MSKVLEEMKTRRSIRKFKPDMIPQDILDRIIEAGTFAANGRGAQNTIIIQVTNKEIRDERPVYAVALPRFLHFRWNPIICLNIITACLGADMCC